MARLAISRDFLAEYVKLDKNVQSAVDKAVATFAKQSQPGQHLQTTQDDRIRIMPVDDRWHGVILAPAIGDTYCLVTVLPQGQAAAYATTRMLTVNQSLVLPEARDENAAKPLRPSLQSTPERTRLHADVPDVPDVPDVTDTDLTRHGVAAPRLPGDLPCRDQRPQKWTGLLRNLRHRLRLPKR